MIYSYSDAAVQTFRVTDLTISAAPRASAWFFLHEGTDRPALQVTSCKEAFAFVWA